MNLIPHSMKRAARSFLAARLPFLLPAASLDAVPALAVFDEAVAGFESAMRNPAIMCNVSFEVIRGMNEALSSFGAEALAEYMFEAAGAASERGVSNESMASKFMTIQLMAQRNLLAKEAMGAILIPLVRAREPGAPIQAARIRDALRSWVESGVVTVDGHATDDEDAREISEFLISQARGANAADFRLAVISMMIRVAVEMAVAQSIPEEMERSLRVVPKRQVERAFRRMQKDLAKRAG